MERADPSESPAARHAGLFAPIEPFDEFLLDVDNGHRLHVEQCGRVDGAPVVVLHGGPASGTSPLQRRFFDPRVHRIVLFDQRGSGRSTPAGALEGNDTASLICDIESIRQRLGIERWLVFGGSWGASLAVAYAAAHLQRCRALLLRGAFLTGEADLDWFFGAAGALLPLPWEALARGLGVAARADRPGTGLALLERLAGRLLGADASAAAAAAHAWRSWEQALIQGWRGTGAAVEPENGPATGDADASAQLHKYRIQAHYLLSRCWLGEPALLRLAAALDGLPTRILHGRLDWVCRPCNALALQRAIRGSVLEWVDAAGHSPFDAPMAEAIVRAVQALHADAP